MSEASSVPFSETKAPESPERLHVGALGLVDISASTMANIGPAYSFYFSFGLIVVTAGIAAPLTIVAAAIAVPVYYLCKPPQPDPYDWFPFKNLVTGRSGP